MEMERTMWSGGLRPLGYAVISTQQQISNSEGNN
jgi:hypothetical protein